jgi:1-acyl-sn-glycerol-3-phosphate acyltransferase
VLAALVQWAAAGFGRNRARLHHWSFALQCWWVGALAGAGLACYGMRLAADGDDAVSPGPILLFSRHASIGDTVLAGLLVSRRHGIVLRYVLKRPLLLDPCLDIVGHRLRNHFVRRGGDDSAREIEAVARLAEDLGPNEGVLLYPEGTRFTPAKRQLLLERFEQTGRLDELARARELRHVIAPRPGGVRALLERNARSERPADVVFCSHAGFDGSATLPDLLRGDLVGRTLHVRFWRVPWGDVPAGASQRDAWLHEQWRAVDRFVEEHVDSVRGSGAR